jgi:hypothetical protein
MLHVLNGDSTRVTLAQSTVPGVFTVWADALHDGPVPADLGSEDLRVMRAQHFATTIGFSAAELMATTRRWDEGLGRYRDHDEVVFWFEHDLFDQLILIRHLHWLSTLDRGATRFSLINIGSFPGFARFRGLGELSPAQLATLLPLRAPISDAQVALGRDAWNRFRAPAPQPFAELLGRDTSVLPFLEGAVRRHLEDFPARATGLSRSERQILEAVADGHATFEEIFVACQAKEERVYMGDTTFRGILDRLVSAPHPLLTRDGRGRYALTATGTEVLAGRADHLALNGIDRWMGGTHLTADRVSRADDLLAV